MACTSVCKLCSNLVISSAVTFADDTLVVNIPAGSYANGQTVCLVIAQTIPDTATITAPVAITIGAGTTQYPLTNRCCSQVVASALRTRTRYKTQVVTSATGGTFRLLGRTCCAPDNSLTAIDGGATA